METKFTGLCDSEGGCICFGDLVIIESKDSEAIYQVDADISIPMLYYLRTIKGEVLPSCLGKLPLTSFYHVSHLRKDTILGSLKPLLKIEILKR